MTLFLRLGVAEISTPWPFRYPLLVKMSIGIASSPRLSGTISGTSYQSMNKKGTQHACHTDYHNKQSARGFTTILS